MFLVLRNCLMVVVYFWWVSSLDWLFVFNWWLVLGVVFENVWFCVFEVRFLFYFDFDCVCDFIEGGEGGVF